MLPKENRLSNKIDFEKVKRMGNKASGKSLMILTLSRGDDKVSRFGIVVSKHVSKRAVDRNRVKRLLRESIMSVISKVSSGYDVVIIARQNIMSLDFSEVNNDLNNVFQKARII